MLNGKHRIYLAGNISADSRTYEWREEATKLLTPEYTVLNPANNQFNKDMLMMHSGGGNADFVQDALTKSQGILIVKDYQLVESSDIVLVNLSIITPDKPPLGTVFELAWSWQLKKPVVAIIGDNLYSKHPFPKAVFSATTYTVEDACELIHYFFEE